MSPRIAVASLVSILLCLSACSKKGSQPLEPQDTTAPGSIADLTATAIDSFTVLLSWTAPGGDGATGTASAYEIRIGNLDHVPSWDWSTWTVVGSPPAPQAAGTTQTLQLSNLAGGAPYSIAMRARDGAGNWSGQSNQAYCQTTGYRDGPVLVVSSQSAPYARVSENGGRTWKDATVTGSQIKFGWLTRAGNAPNMLYATAPAFGQNLLGTGASRIWISVDHGLTWQVNTEAVVSSGSVLTGGGCRTLIAAPNHPGLLFASLTGVCDAGGNNCCGNCSGKVYRSTDVGLTWTVIGSDLPLQPFPPYQNTTLPYPAMAVDPVDPQRIYIGGDYFCYSDGGSTNCFPALWYTSNGGGNWTGATTGLSNANIHTLAISPTAPSRLLASTSQGIFLSVNSGLHWTNVSSLSGPLVFTHDPSNPQVIYTPQSKSVDGGVTWSPMPTPVDARIRIEADPSRNEVYAVGTGGVYRSADGGATWRQVLSASGLTSMVVLPDMP